jgi:hypothetical protein
MDEGSDGQRNGSSEETRNGGSEEVLDGGSDGGSEGHDGREEARRLQRGNEEARLV